MKNLVFTYNEELIKISVKKEIQKDDLSIEAEIVVDDEKNYQICKKNGVSTPVNKNCVIDPALLTLMNKCI